VRTACGSDSWWNLLVAIVLAIVLACPHPIRIEGAAAGAMAMANV
jgi:hypothetical protein